MKGSVEDRFWAKANVQSEDQCWEWQANRDMNGYGRISGAGKRRFLAHRVAWTIANGPIPSGMVVMHKCDNPPCCNPSHLTLGTQEMNMKDMAAKGRAQRGTAHHNSKLTDDAVRLIRDNRTLSARKLAKQLGVGVWTIHNVRSGKRWAHVTQGAAQ